MVRGEGAWQPCGEGRGVLQPCGEGLRGHQDFVVVGWVREWVGGREHISTL